MSRYRLELTREEELVLLRHCSDARYLEPGIWTCALNVVQKAGLNRAIQSSGWGLPNQRLEEKASGRVEKVSPAHTASEPRTPTRAPSGMS